MPNVKIKIEPIGPEVDYDSALGENPTCSLCKKEIKIGEEVKQTFIGKVIVIDETRLEELLPGPTELGIKAKTYSLVHTYCKHETH